MPALTADVTAATRDAVTVTWSDPAILSRYPRARDASKGEVGGYCDVAADAQALVDARGALIGVERRRFVVGVADVVMIDPTTGVPTVQLIDAAQAVNAPGLPTRYELNLNDETTVLEAMT